MNRMQGIQVVVFDLDDTLYFEDEYVHSGFQAVADFLRVQAEVDSRMVFEFCWQQHISGQRGHIFDAVKEHFEIAAPVSELVQVYRTHAPQIRLTADVDALLKRLRLNAFKLAVITDGPLVMQQAKVKALGLHNKVDCVICTDQYGKEHWKPHPKAFLEIMHAFAVPGHACVYIGDNPIKDFIAPRALGWKTIRYQDPRQLRAHIHPEHAGAAPDAVVSSLQAFEQLLPATATADQAT